MPMSPSCVRLHFESLHLQRCQVWQQRVRECTRHLTFGPFLGCVQYVVTHLLFAPHPVIPKCQVIYSVF